MKLKLLKTAMRSMFILIFSALSLSSISCNSDDDSPNPKKYFVKCKINDVQKVDNFNSNIDDFEGSSIFEEYPTGSYTFQVFLGVINMKINQKPLEVKTYSWNNSTSNLTFNTWFRYTDPQTGIKFTAHTVQGLSPAGSNMTLKITSLDNNEVKGTFSGSFNAVEEGGTQQKTFNITNGEFHAPLR